MSDDDKELHDELEGRELLERLPIAKLLISRVDAVTDSDGQIETDDVVAPIIAALVSLERLIREGD